MWASLNPGFSDLRDEVPINAWNKPFLVMFMKYSIVTRIYTEILINQAVDNFTSSRFRESRLNTFSAASGDFAKVTAIFFPLLPTKPQKAKMTVICGNLWKFLFAHPPRTACGFAKREREFLSIPFARHNTGDFWKCQKWAQKNRKPFLDFLSWCAVLYSGGYSVFM